MARNAEYVKRQMFGKKKFLYFFRKIKPDAQTTILPIRRGGE